MLHTLWLESDDGTGTVTAHGEKTFWHGIEAILRAAGADLAALNGKSAAECTGPFEIAHYALLADPDRFVAYESLDGWVSITAALSVVLDVRHTLIEVPDAILRVDLS